MTLTNRQRAVPPSMFADETLMELPPPVRLTGIGLRFYVDDEGRGSATPALIRGQLWPLDTAVTDATIREHLRALVKVGYIETYSINGRKLLALTDWPSVDRGSRSRLPAPPTTEPLARSSRASRETFAVEGGGEEGREDGREEGAGEGGRGPSRDARDETEPSPFCRKHQPHGTDFACGGCASARKRHDQWLRAEAEAEAEGLAE